MPRFHWIIRLACIRIEYSSDPRYLTVTEYFIDYTHVRDIGHTQDIRWNCLHCPKTYVHFAGYRSTSQVWLPVTHNQVVNDLHIFISGGIFGAARPLISINALSPPPKFCSPFCSPCYKKETHFQVFSWSIREFPWESFPSYKDILSPLSLQISPFCTLDALSSLNTVVKKQSSVTKCFLLSRWLLIK